MYGWFDFSNSSNAGIFGQSALCGQRGEKEWWRVHIIRPLWRIGNAAHNARWWLSYRIAPKHKYHLVNTGLKPGYYDVDYLMLHACFALLCRYVETEHGGDMRLQEWADRLATEPDTNAPEGWQAAQGKRESEAVALYRWWKVQRPADQARHDEMLHHLYSGKWEPRTDDEGAKSIGPRRKWADEAMQMRDEMWALEAKIERDEQVMLHRLIEIRGGLWT